MRQSLFNYSHKILEYLFYVLFFFTPFIFFSFQLKPNTSELFEINKLYFVYIITVLIVSAWLIKSISIGKFLFQKTVLFIPLLLFLLTQIISTVYSIDFHTSIWGYYSRGNGGLLSLITYYFLYFAYVSNLDIQHVKKSIKFLLASAIILSIWGISEHFGASPSCVLINNKFNDGCWVQDVQDRVFATLGQPNWLSAWLVAVLPFALLPIFSGLKNKINILNSKSLKIHIIISALILLAINYTKSDAGYLGVSAIFIVFLFYLIPKKNTAKHIVLYFLILTTILFSAFYGWNKAMKNCFDLNPQSVQVQGGTDSCKIRAIVWNGAINIWRAYPIFGSGVETFAYSYYNFRPIEHNSTSEWDLLYNKAHNEFLNYLANTGGIGLLTYLGIIGTFLYYCIFRIRNIEYRIEKNTLNSRSLILISIFAGFSSILVTNFFGFSVVTIQLLFFLYPAFVWVIASPENSAKEVASRKLSIKHFSLLILTLGATSYTLLCIFQIWYSDILYTSAQSLNNDGAYSDAFVKIRKALEIRSDEPIYYDQLARISSNISVTENETKDASKSAEFKQLAQDASDVATSISPYNLSLIKSQAVIYQKFALINPEELSKVLVPLEKAIKLAPTDPKVHYNLGQIHERLGQYNEARKIFEDTIKLKSDYYDARIGLATVFTKIGMKNEAIEQYQWILKNLDPNDQEVKNSLINLQSLKLK